jgi:hypothetical protein
VFSDKHRIELEIVVSYASKFMVLTLCLCYLKSYCMGRKTAFFQRAFKFTYYARNRSPLQEKKIITIKLKKIE